MEIDNTDAPYWVALNAIPNMGAVHARRLLDYFKTAKAAWEAPEKTLETVDLQPQVKTSFLHHRSLIDPQKEIHKIQSQNISLITIFDQNYPRLLQEVYDPPMMLFVKGDVTVLSGNLFSVVGTRSITAYGDRVARYFVNELVSCGFVIVSGMARGIDSVSHREAIARKGLTIAVLGSGLDMIYPPENRPLAEEISAHGCIISEFPLGMPPLRQNFPIRNRLISGLSRGLLVIEAAEKSGTINIANQALDQNREVFAVPGSIFNPLSQGTLNLIKNGAKPCQNINDILEELGLEAIAQKAIALVTNLSAEEKLILERLTESDMVNTDEIVKLIKLPISKVNAILTKMELNGLIIQAKGSNYALKK